MQVYKMIKIKKEVWQRLRKLAFANEQQMTKFIESLLDKWEK